MKKSLFIMLLSLLLVSACLVMTGCDFGADDKCDHAFDAFASDDTNHWSVCSKCNAEEPDSTKVAHAYTDSTVTKQPTCTAEGTRELKCVCGKAITESVSKIKHDVGNEFIPDPESSNRHYQVCNICKAELNKATHEFKLPAYDGDNHWLACKCGAPGTKTAHTWVDVDPDDNSIVISQKCENCEATKTDVANPDHTHDWDEGEVTKEPVSCSEPGVKTFKCTVTDCPATETEAILVPHEYTGAWGYTDTEHWQNCQCGELAPESEREPHNFEFNEEENVYKCECNKVKKEQSDGYIDPDGWT